MIRICDAGEPPPFTLRGRRGAVTYNVLFKYALKINRNQYTYIVQTLTSLFDLLKLKNDVSSRASLHKSDASIHL